MNKDDWVYYTGYRLGTAPTHFGLANIHTEIKRIHIALHMTPAIDC